MHTLYVSSDILSSNKAIISGRGPSEHPGVSPSPSLHSESGQAPRASGLFIPVGRKAASLSTGLVAWFLYVFVQGEITPSKPRSVTILESGHCN